MAVTIIVILIVQTILTAILLYAIVATHMQLVTTLKDHVSGELCLIRKILDDQEAHRIGMMAREAQIRLDAGPGEPGKAEAAIDAARVTEGQALDIKRQECARKRAAVDALADPWFLK